MMQAITPDIFYTPLALRGTKIEIEPNLVRYFQNKFEQWSVIHSGTLTDRVVFYKNSPCWNQPHNKPMKSLMGSENEIPTT